MLTFVNNMPPEQQKTETVGKKNYSPDLLQRLALGVMLLLTIITFIGANLHAVLWQSSQWLVSTVLPAVVVQLTNDERSGLSEAPLRRNSTLDEAARMKAEHMAKNEYFAHYAPDGTSPWYWFDQAGYTYAHAGENLAIHFSDSTEVVEAWMNSPKHRENIVNGNYTEIGVGTAKGEFEGYDTVYVVQLFGTPAVAAVPTPRPVPPSEPLPSPAPVAEVIETEIAASEPEETVLAVSESADEEIIVSTSSDSVASSSVVAATTSSTTPTEPSVVATATSEDTVIIESTMIATSSGLAIATVYEERGEERKFLLGALVTKPNTLLQYVYIIFALIVVGLLVASIIIEYRRMRLMQMAYGAGLLLVMGGLWFVHSLLTMGAVIV